MSDINNINNTTNLTKLNTETIIGIAVVVIIAAIILININFSQDLKKKPLQVNIPPIPIDGQINKTEHFGVTDSVIGINADDIIKNIMKSQNVKNLQTNTNSLISSFNKTANKNVESVSQISKNISKNTQSLVNGIQTDIKKNTQSGIATAISAVDSIKIPIADTNIKPSQKIPQHSIIVSQELPSYSTLDKLPNIVRAEEQMVTNMVNKPQQLLPRLPKHIEPQQEQIGVNQSVLVNENDIEPSESDIKRIKFPDDDDIVDYTNGAVNFKNIKSKRFIPQHEYVKSHFDQCNATTLKSTNDQMLANSAEINTMKFPICDNSDDTINDDYDINITDVYRQKQMYVKSYFEDPIVRAYNIDTYGNATFLANTGLIKLDKEVSHPKPSGYIFKSSPAYKR